MLPVLKKKKVNVIYKGKIYGARQTPTGLIGGGIGYKNIITKGDIVVKDIDSFINALESASPYTTIIIAPGSVFDCTERIYTDKLVFKIKDNITIAGNRGQNGSKGPLIKSDSFPTNPLFLITGNNVRITGLRIKGPDPRRRMEHHKRSFAPERGDSSVQHEYYYRFPVSNAIQVTGNKSTIDNCELSGWSFAAIYLKLGSGHHVHHCYIHHNQYNGLGYGVCLDSASALITHNLFNWNRHSIAGTGNMETSYEASDNIEMGISLSHCFDMHGGKDRKDGTNIAGKQISIHHNTFFPENQKPIVIRGQSLKRVYITQNWFAGYSKKFPSRPAVRAEGKNIVFDNFPPTSLWSENW